MVLEKWLCLHHFHTGRRGPAIRFRDPSHYSLNCCHVTHCAATSVLTDSDDQLRRWQADMAGNDVTDGCSKVRPTGVDVLSATGSTSDRPSLQSTADFSQQTVQNAVTQTPVTPRLCLLDVDDHCDGKVSTTVRVLSCLDDAITRQPTCMDTQGYHYLRHAIRRVCWLVIVSQFVSSLTSGHWLEVGQVNVSRSRHRSGAFELYVESMRVSQRYFSACSLIVCMQ